MPTIFKIHKEKYSLREDTHKKKVVFVVVGPIRFYPPYTPMAKWSMPLFFLSFFIFF